MSAADCKAARRKCKLRYGSGRRVRSVSEAMAAEKVKASRAIVASKKK